jgi:hypothetical protein
MTSGYRVGCQGASILTNQLMGGFFVVEKKGKSLLGFAVSQDQLWSRRGA